MATFRSLSTLVTFASLATTILADPSPNAVKVCSILTQQYPEQVGDSGLELSNLTIGLDYSAARTGYWSQANAGVKPACIFFPASTQDVSFAVKTLNNYTDVPWGVKGGGHNPNVGFSSTQDGVLLSMEQNWATTRLDEDNLAHIGPGSRWIDVATALDPYHRAVASGRLGDVGAAGLTLGGGLSFLSTEHGLTADTVHHYEVVLADGTITTASKSQNSDLFYALKGGGNQFAIVTDFVLETFPIGNVWGGYKIFAMDRKDAVLRATHNLLSDYYDPKAAVIVTFTTTLHTLVDIFVVFFFYNDPSGPGEILSEFNSIPSMLDGTRADRSYKDLLDANSDFSLKGLRYLIRTGTLPNLPGDAGLDIYNYTLDSWYELAKQYQSQTPLDLLAFSMAFQPVPYTLANASVHAPHGVNLLGLDPRHGDKLFMEYDVSWLSSATDAAAAAFMTNITQPVQDYARRKYATAKPTHYVSGETAVTNFNPLFMNDAMYNQDPVRSYGEATYAKLKAIQEQRDPEGFFSRRAGGFKFT
ncbi:FAD-binding domain-containing [Lecanosticta acicola]|uniref:FAD-binding domain-containing n=1 Tax=Lecanosticta acicola TaxID=111012 RepID=A0AAI8YV57_9PEZI|nr:FAD-binding domain-containing [Lecanosticta acicola]